jgi:hypothetical protein
VTTGSVRVLLNRLGDELNATWNRMDGGSASVLSASDQVQALARELSAQIPDSDLPVEARYMATRAVEAFESLATALETESRNRGGVDRSVIDRAWVGALLCAAQAILWADTLAQGPS